MSRLGITNSQPSDWSRSTGYYSRLTVASNAMVWRREDHYPPAPAETNVVNPGLFVGRRIFRTEMLDLGHCNYQFELGKFILWTKIFVIYETYSESRLNTDFSRVKSGDLFCVRIQRTSPTIWQRREYGAELLFRVPHNFVDSFVTIQEWELNPKTHSQTVRIDFLNRVQLPVTCPYESPAYWSRLRAATLGGLGQISREVQEYHVVEQIIPPSTAREILTELGFYSARPLDQIQQAFPPIYNPQSTQGSENMDTCEITPQAELVADSHVMLQHLRNQRHIRERYGHHLGIKPFWTVQVLLFDFKVFTFP